jgi:catechol O-methyltransferase
MLESRRDELQGNPQAVLDAMDKFGSNKYLMNVGGPKAKLVEDIIQERKPKVCTLLFI